MPTPYDQDLVNLYRSPRLIYRAIDDTSASDKAFVFALENDPVNAAFSSLGVPKPRSPSDLTRWFERLKDSPLTVLACLPASEDTATSEASDEKTTDGKTEEKAPTPIGFVTLFNARGGGSGPSHHRCLMLGITLATEYRGKGYGGEMINWVLDYGFRRAGCHRIELCAWSYNPNAIRLYKMLGFTEEGREREALWFDRKWWDVVGMSMLEGEWEVLRGLRKPVGKEA